MAGRIVTSTINDDTGVLATQNGMTGIAKAWVNYNGVAGTITGSFNVGSVTKSGTGLYIVNFTTAMPNANYATTAAVRKNDTSNDGNMAVVLGATNTAYSTTQLQVTTRYISNEGLKDAELVCVSVFS